jgi:nucleoside-diphosphate-sugar epimerase
MHVFLTGAGGFLGGAIARALRARGDQVTALVRRNEPELSALGVRLQPGDLAYAADVLKAAEDAEAVIHTAAKPGHFGSREDFYQANVLGTRHVLDACLRHAIPKLVYTSTPSIVHAGKDLEGVDERAPIAQHFLAHYPATKAEAERMVLQAHSADLATVALRPHLIWGPGDRHLLPRLLERARRGKLRFVGRSKKIDTVYIDNAVDAHLSALDRLHPDAACGGKAYFIAQDEPLTLDEMVNRLIACADLAPVSKRVPFALAYGVGAVLELLYSVLPLQGEPIMTRFLAVHLSTAHWYDLSAAKRDLGYRPRVSLEQGLRNLRAHVQAGARA